PGLQLYERLLNVGLRPALVGGSGKDSNAVPLGAVRTYARVSPGEEFTLAGWIEAVRARRTFVTNGPLLSLDVSGHGPGAVLAAVAGQRLAVRAEARSHTPIVQIEVVFNGTVIASSSESVIETEVPISGSGWLAARCSGRPTLDAEAPFAQTGPVWVDVPG